jgi:hypothetical protein
MRVRGFVRVLQALQPRLGDVVLVGGWAWYLYRKYLTGERSFPGEFTLDVDVAAPRRLPTIGPELDELLEASHFKLKMEGDERPPVSRHSWPSAEAPEAVVEFLTPALAAGVETTREISGIVAQQLRYLDLLLDDPLELDVHERERGESFDGSVRVPRVGSFVLHKALTYRKRKEKEKRSKDLFYLFDLADETRNLGGRIDSDLAFVTGKRGSKWSLKAANSLQEDCGTPEADAIGRVCDQIPKERRPSRRYVSETFGRLAQRFRGVSPRVQPPR